MSGIFGMNIKMAIYGESHGKSIGVVEPLFGVLVVLMAAWARPLMPWLLSFAAGAMLYVSGPRGAFAVP